MSSKATTPSRPKQAKYRPTDRAYVELYRSNRKAHAQAIEAGHKAQQVRRDERAREALRLHGQGYTVQALARLYRRDVRTIRRWLRRAGPKAPDQRRQHRSLKARRAQQAKRQAQARRLLERGLTQKEAAYRLGISRETLRLWAQKSG